jgi:WD40 repeat protein
VIDASFLWELSSQTRASWSKSMKNAIFPIATVAWSVGILIVFSTAMFAQAPPSSETEPAPVEQSLSRWEGHKGAIWSVAFSPDGKLAATGGGDFSLDLMQPDPGQEDRVIRIWEVATGNLMQTLSGHKECVVAVAFSPDGILLATGDQTIGVPGVVKIWDIASGQEKKSLSGHKLGITTVGFSNDGKLLAAGGLDRSIKVWEADEFKPKRAFQVANPKYDPKQPPHKSELGGKVSGLAFGPGSLLATTNSFPMIKDKHGDGVDVKLWDVTTGKAKRSMRLAYNSYSKVAVSSDGKRVAANGPTSLHVFDTASGKELLVIPKASGTSLTFSPDGRWIAAGCSTVEVGAGITPVPSNDELRIYDTNSGEMIAALTGHRRRIRSVAFSPDGKRLISGGTDSVARLWDVEKLLDK